MNSERKHFIGYWMSIIGFALLVSGGLFHSALSLDAPVGMISAILGFVMFLVGAELALNNHEYEESGSD